MIIVGEKLNSSVPKTLEALTAHEEAYLIEMIQKQEEAGADYLDINTALTGENEIQDMEWLVRLALAHSDCGIMIDSPNVEAIQAVLPKISGRKLFVNSVSLDEKYEVLFPVLKEANASVVCLPISGRAIPQTAAERLENAKKLLEKLIKAGISAEQIYMDALAEAVATAPEAPSVTLDTVRLYRESFRDSHIICGLSNVSFGLPKRVKLNSLFLAMCMQSGMDSVIMDITSPTMREALASTNVLLGKDEYCMDYITMMREIG